MIIDGKKIAEDLRERLKKDIGQIPSTQTKPGLTVILIGDDTASQIYVKNKEKFANEIGIRSEVIRFNSTITEQELIKQIHILNNNKAVHGILVQLPRQSILIQKKLLVKLIQIKM